MSGRPLVTIEELSRWIDGELSEAERADVEARLRQCPISPKLLDRMRSITERVGAAILTEPGAEEAPRCGDCLDDETLTRLADNLLTPGMKKEVEAHVLSCERCLAMVLESLRATTTMHRGDWPDLPESVREHGSLRHLVHVQERSLGKEEISRLELILDQSQESGGRCGSGSYLATVLLRALDERSAEFFATLKKEGQPVAGQKLVLTDKVAMRKTFDDVTDAQGRVRVPRLRAGQYDAHFPGTKLIVEVRVRETRESRH